MNPGQPGSIVQCRREGEIHLIVGYGVALEDTLKCNLDSTSAHLSWGKGSYSTVAALCDRSYHKPTKTDCVQGHNRQRIKLKHVSVSASYALLKQLWLYLRLQFSGSKGWQQQPGTDFKRIPNLKFISHCCTRLFE